LGKNASQPTQTPIEEQLNTLLQFLRSMPMNELSVQQITVLHELGISEFIGESGANFIERNIRISNYDVSTAHARVQDAMTQIASAHQRLQSYQEALDALDLPVESQLLSTDEMITVRVGFQGGAAIHDIVDWKRSASRWHEIVRGIALANDESPNETKVIGATNGSLILILSATLATTTTLALIATEIHKTATKLLDIKIKWEELKQSEIATKTMREEFKAVEQRTREDAVESIIKELQATNGNLNGEHINALEKSVKGLLTFNEQGGYLDFVAPEQSDDVENDDESDEPVIKNPALGKAYEAIIDFQSNRDAYKLLTFDNDDD
jgi:hypothetical protein